MASATMWLYQDPYFTDFMQPGSIQSSIPFNAPYVKPSNMSPFEIINSPFFPLLGNGFNISTADATGAQSSSPVDVVGSASQTTSPLPITFSGNLENNLMYAQTRSSLRVGQGNDWNSISNQWMSSSI